MSDKEPLTVPDDPAASALNWLAKSEAPAHRSDTAVWRSRVIARADVFARLEGARQQGRVADALERIAAVAEALISDET